jgi:transcriptional regulator with XRE-family HTH domain
VRTALNPHPRPVGHLLREWRQRRRYSQLALACDAQISPRHLSFIESGRSRPSRQMLLHLAERLDLPLRDRNLLLVAAGFAPVFKESSLDHPDLASVRRAIDLVLSGHRPFPALAIDRRWNLVAANDAVAPLIAGAAQPLLQPPMNVLRLSLHPDGLAPRIVNFPQWRAHLLARLRRQVELSADPALTDLLDELQRYPAPAEARAAPELPAEHVVPLRLRTADGTLAFISTTMVFGTPLDVVSSELAIESFFPADPQTAEALQGQAG